MSFYEICIFYFVAFLTYWWVWRMSLKLILWFAFQFSRNAIHEEIPGPCWVDTLSVWGDDHSWVNTCWAIDGIWAKVYSDLLSFWFRKFSVNSYYWVYIKLDGWGTCKSSWFWSMSIVAPNVLWPAVGTVTVLLISYPTRLACLPDFPAITYKVCKQGSLPAGSHSEFGCCTQEC